MSASVIPFVLLTLLFLSACCCQVSTVQRRRPQRQVSHVSSNGIRATVAPPLDDLNNLDMLSKRLMSKYSERPTNKLNERSKPSLKQMQHLVGLNTRLDTMGSLDGMELSSSSYDGYVPDQEDNEQKWLQTVDMGYSDEVEDDQDEDYDYYYYSS